MRINKYIATKTKYSRRASEDFVIQGRIKVNGNTIKKLSTLVGESDIVTLDDIVISEIKNKYHYYLLNKPPNVISSVKDQFGRKTVKDFFDINLNIYPVGRLDYNSRGLILMTNDGNLTYNITHPSNEVEKTYLVKIDSPMSKDQVNEFKEGIILDGKLTSPAVIELYDSKKSVYLVKIIEGRNRQIRKMMDYLGKKVLDLQRIAIEKITLNGIEEGNYRKLNKDEITYLKSI